MVKGNVKRPAESRGPPDLVRGSFRDHVARVNDEFRSLFDGCARKGAEDFRSLFRILVLHGESAVVRTPEMNVRHDDEFHFSMCSFHMFFLWFFRMCLPSALLFVHHSRLVNRKSFMKSNSSC